MDKDSDFPQGDLRVSTVTPKGEVWVGDVVGRKFTPIVTDFLDYYQSQGDVWYFPAGNPHSIQSKNTSAGGSEFLLIFDKGTFTEDSTFLLTDWLAHVPKHVLAKSFGLEDDLQALEHIPDEELYIFDCKTLW